MKNATKNAISDNIGFTAKEVADVLGKKHKDVLRDIDRLITEGVFKDNEDVTRGLIDIGDKVRTLYVLTHTASMVLVTGYSVADLNLFLDYLHIREDSEESKKRFDQTVELIAERCDKLITLKSLYINNIQKNNRLKVEHDAQIRSYDLRVEALWETLHEERAEVTALREEIRELKADRETYATALKSTSAVLVIHKREALQQEQKYTTLRSDYCELQDKMDAIDAEG